MRKFFLTLDLEEWYHLEYFQHIVNNKEKEDLFTTRLDFFFDLLDKYNIKITVFILAELAKKHPNVIKGIVTRGHEIACHGLNHGLLYEKTNDEFIEEIKEAKKILEDISGQEVIGYRAPCYSMENEKLPLLQDLGFKYDSSYIRFSQHDLYKMINLEGFSQKEDLIYEKDNFYEFEIPTYNISKLNIPISGGGYFRLLPFFLYKLLFNSFSKFNNNFVFYLHPFELDSLRFEIPRVSRVTKFRFSVGRKNVLHNLEKLIVNCLDKGYYFYKMNENIK